MIAGNKNNLKSMIGDVDVVLITLDTLRFDVAQRAHRAGRLPTLSPYLGDEGWECRHTPASFTYAAHHAFFAGFLPTPITPGPHTRLFASQFAGSETTDAGTFLFDEPTLPQALSARGYQTICVGGTGFFNPQNALGRVLPELFDEAHWSSRLGVTDRQSECHQVECAISCLRRCATKPAFLFINMGAIHQPNWFYGSEATEAANESDTQAAQPKDTLATHTAALVAVDAALAPLIEFCRRRSTFCIVCSDHGTAYGESGHYGHRLAHEVVWNVPYAEFML